MPIEPRVEMTVASPDGDGWTGIGWSWHWPEPVRVASTAVHGGGIGDRTWVANVTVDHHYATPDPARHGATLATAFGSTADGAVLMTAFDVRRSLCARREDVLVHASIAIGAVGWAADGEGASAVWRPGTVNTVVWVPEPLVDAALLNLLTTVAEAKCQAFGERAVPGTSTPSDAIVVACPIGPAGDDGRFGGPRSHWGSRVARVVHRTLLDGIDGSARRSAGDDGSWDPG